MRAAAVVLAAFSGCLMVYSIYCKSKEDMLGVQAAGSAFALAASLLSGCWVAVILSALAIVRNLWTAGKPRKYFVVAGSRSRGYSFMGESWYFPACCFF